MTKEEIIKLVEQERVNFIHLQFTDILGMMKNISIPVTQLEKALNGELMFDGSSIEGFVRIEESDMYLKPDLDTFMILPWESPVSDGKSARLICDVYTSDEEPFIGCPRYILRRALQEAEKMGFSEDGKLTAKAGDASVFLSR